MFAVQKHTQTYIREEELKNRVATVYFGKYDCTRIVGNIDFCVSPKRRDVRQTEFIPSDSLYWAEAKNHPADIYRMLAQLVLTIKGEQNGYMSPPRFVGCFDNEKIAFAEYHHVLPVFNLNDFNWTQTPSAVDEKTVDTLRDVVPMDKISVFRFGADDMEIKDFIRKNLVQGDSPALATQIDKNNFIFVYQKWLREVMPHIDAPWDVLKKKYALYDRDFFLAEMNVDDNGTPEVADDRPAEDFYITFDANVREPYTIRRKNEDELNFNLTFGFKPDGLSAYVSFWRRYKRPPKREYWDFIVNRLDLLVPQDVRERKGSFFTPAIWVEKGQQYIADVLGEDWQEDHYVWDCCAGTGNLLAGLTNKYRIWASTLDQQDVDVMRERIKNGANLLDSHVFRFDFLNDPFDKLPQGLKDIITDPEKRRRLVIYINPPYAEAGDAKQRAGTGQNKTDVSVSHSTYDRYVDKISLAGRELFALFLMRIHDEVPGCVIGQFSKLKHLQSPNFKAFRKAFRGALEKCFIVPADTFDNVKGKFPIGFFVWRLKDVASATRSFGVLEIGENSGKTPELQDSRPPSSESNSSSGVFTEAAADVYDREGNFIGSKNVYAYDDIDNIGKWVNSFRHDNGLHLGFMSNGRNDFQNTNLVYFINDKNQLSTPRGWWITPPNLIPMCIFVAVRHSVEATWLNDRDTFLYPNVGWMNDATFQMGSMVYTLFSDFNVIKSSVGINHWIPFTEEEVGANDCFASHFMSDFINGRAGSPLPADTAVAGRPPYQGELGLENVELCKCGNMEICKQPISDAPHFHNSTIPHFSPAARAVLDAGRELWRYYHAQPNANPNASYYDIRLHFQGVKKTASGKEQMNAMSSDATYNALLAALRSAHKALAAQIAPKVDEDGFLKM